MPKFDCGKKVEKLSTLSVTVEQMSKALKSLNPSKSPGPDEIHPKILREVADEMAVPLSYLFNVCMKHGKLPSDWKKAEVRPLFKKGDKSQPGNYRPVSLTSIVCKVFEGFIRDSLTAHLIRNQLLSEHQFGFTSGRSCVTNLLNSLLDWMCEIDQGRPVDVIYLDFKKAFDTVPHKRLISKLEGYGIDGNVLNIIQDFLSDRSQNVVVEGNSSAPIKVTSGVPQGSVLGPTLFVYYINDLPALVKSVAKVFADDTKLYEAVDCVKGKNKLQNDIDALTDWTQKWLMQFNSDKCKVLHLGKKNPQYSYCMGSTMLQKANSEKDLGVIVDTDLSFENHMNEVVKKANKIAGLILRTINFNNKDILVPLFKTLVRPLLEYGNAVWSPILKKHIHMIEDVQRRFTKRIAGLKDKPYEDRLRELKLPSLEFRRIRGDLIEAYKILNKIYDETTTERLLPLSANINTRGHNFKVEKKSANTRLFLNFFSNRINTRWNQLPEACVSAATVNGFKNQVDKFLCDIKYCTDIEQ